MNREELAKKMEQTAERMENDKAKYAVEEKVQEGRGEELWTFIFKANKKSELGKALKIIAAEAIARTVGYGAYNIRNWAYNQPISMEMKGDELSMIFQRWAETIPKGYIETIGRRVELPEKDAFIKAEIKPKNKIELTINFVKVRSKEEAERLKTSIPDECPKCKAVIEKELIEKLRNNEIIECPYCGTTIQAKRGAI